MFGRRAPRNARAGSGFVWPDSGTGTPVAVADVFGPRPFSAHISTVGYDYDFHRGVDVSLNVQDPLYAPQAGAVSRMHRSHFGFETAAQLGYWTETDAGGSATFAREAPSSLRIVGSRVGAETFPTVARYAVSKELIAIGDTWELRLGFTNAPALAAGAVGIAAYNAANGEYTSLEYDGTTATVRGVGSGGALAVAGTALATASKTWLRMTYDGANYTWDVSADASTWTNVATSAAPTFTSPTVPLFAPTVYWKSTDTNAATVTVDVDFIGWTHGGSIDRFGNWLQISNNVGRTIQMHFTDIEVELGQFVEAGQRLGTVGLTGFDARSGNILSPHVHLEYVPDNGYSYDKDTPVNPLDDGLLPRVNTSANVTVTRSTANDPDGVDSWRLRIQVARTDQDFDVNTVTLTGASASRTINFNTRSGLNADNDIPKQSGVYIVPSAFTTASTEYEVSVYFNKSVVGSFTSASVTDTDGTVLWSE